jgi:hypothetical protein
MEEEAITDETVAALDRARRSLARGEGISHEEILQEFGLGSKLPPAFAKSTLPKTA